VIRKYHPSDLEDLLSVWTAASEIAHPFLSSEFLEQERHNIPNVYLPIAETWVWETDGCVVGFIALLGDEVGAIFVHPANQGIGVGRALMDKARSLREQLEVEVFKENALGRGFYARYGFELVHEELHEPTGQQMLRLRLAAAETM